MTRAKGPECYPLRFVGLDLETTGVNAATDMIIEVGAARMVDGEIVDVFETYVDPGCPIPSDVIHITGITDKDVAGAPSIDEVLPRLVDFLGDDPIVAHHAPFDTGFLQAAAGRKTDLLVGVHGVFDTLPLSRALIPALRNHRLVTLVDFFDIPIERSHRAMDDAEAVAALFLKLLGVFDQIGPALLDRMARLADPQTLKLVRAARERTKDRLAPFALPDHGSKSRMLLRYDNVHCPGAQRVPVEEHVGVDLDEMESLLEPGGPVARELPGYEERHEQVEMMRAVGDSLSNGVHLMVEAGTGVGKSLAYLVPAVHFAVRNGERVVVSTNTRNLQEQLFLKDIPFLAKTLDFDFSAALLKGRGNYLCQMRWRGLLERGLSPEERASILPVVIWEAGTTSGDISENTAFRRESYLWSRISADGGPCLGSACPHNDKCYLMNARRASQAAHMVVVNHSLLFSDSEAENRILGDYAYAVCDEAHNIEQVATEHLGRRVSAWRARSALDNLFRKDGVDTGVVAELMAALTAGSSGGIMSTALVAAERLVEDVAAAQAETERFFSALSVRHVELNGGRPVEFGKLRYRSDGSISQLIHGELDGLMSALLTVADGAERLADLVVDSGLDKTETIVQGLEFHAGRTRELRDDLGYVARADDEDSVYWLEIRTWHDELSCELRCAPVCVAEKMGDFLYSKVDSLILTSATMTVDGSFGFMMERLGLDLIPDWKVLTLDVGSPYDYDAQAIGIVAGYLQQPSSAGFNQTVADLVVKLGAPASGGTLVLFTSRSSLDAVFKAVRDPLTAAGKLVIAQGHGAGPSALLEEFAAETDSVLLATSSFWEGVDVPGRSLEQLIIVKLPFPVPSDPVVEAHCERYEQSGERSFDRYMVPRTAIRLRQGFGRLIRSTTDTGAVVFLDSRLASRAYGDRLLEQLPTGVIIVRSESELVSRLEALHESRIGG